MFNAGKEIEAMKHLTLITSLHRFIATIVRDTAQENVMNAHEETCLFLVVNQPKKYNSNQY